MRHPVPRYTMRGAALACLALALLAAPPAAQEPADQPSVGIAFTLAEPAFVNQYDTARRAAIADSCVAAYAARLAESLGFIAFDPADTVNVLTLTLGRTAEDRGADTGPWPVYLNLDLVGEAVVDDTTPVRWEFRAQDRFLDLIPPADELVDELVRLAEQRLERDGGRAELVENLFSNLVLAQRAFPLREEIGFLLPIDRSRWRIGPESEFVIVADVATATHRQENRTHRVVDVGDCLALADGVPAFYLQKIQVRVVDQDHKIEELRNATQVVPRAIFLTVYRAPREGVDVATPTTLDLGEMDR